MDDPPLTVDFTIDVRLAQIQREGLTVVPDASGVLKHVRIAEIVIAARRQMAQLVADRSFQRVDKVLPVAAESILANIGLQRIHIEDEELCARNIRRHDGVEITSFNGSRDAQLDRAD